MDLGIAGRKAIVCASSRGLGRACAQALAAAGCEVVINGLDAARLEATAAELGKATGAKIIPVKADVGTAEGQAALFAACPEPDILVNITSGTVKLPQAGLDLSSAARGGLTIFLAGVARQVAASNVTINSLLPGAYETDRLKTVLGNLAKRKGVSYEDAKAERIASIPAKRLGDLDGFGAACAFLCSAQAGFITGQNLTIDGGAFPGVF
jgi:3-oxoacyl-[acyl-carrier protein] reductase